MSAPSLPIVLFTLADGLTRGGLPEPVEVRVNGARELVLDFEADEGAARRWAEGAGIDLADRYQWRTQPYAGPADSSIAGQQFTLINGYGEWQGIPVRITALVPADQPAEVMS